MTAAAIETLTLTARPYQSFDDFWKVRQLLIDAYPLVPPDFNWDIRRWDGWHFHRADASWNPLWAEQICLWEAPDGTLAAVVHPEGPGSVFLEIHPAYRHLVEAEMIAWAEAHLALPTHDGQSRQLELFVYEYDSPRRALLTERGYEKTPHGGVVRRMRLGHKPLPAAEMAAGYTLRTTYPDDGDCQRIADVLNAGFERDFHQAAEYRTFTAQSPSFRHDLNLVAEAPDGSFAAHVGFTCCAEARYGIIEPVVTHPDHRRKGLAQALIYDGLHRLAALDVADVYVGTGDMIPANRLYDSIGFTEAYKGYVWRQALA